MTTGDAWRWLRQPARFVRWRPDRLADDCSLDQLERSWSVWRSAAGIRVRRGDTDVDAHGRAKLMESVPAERPNSRARVPRCIPS